MMCKYKVTIAVMTYNRSRFLDLMLESIQNQTYRDFVVKVYDNGSTDETDYVVQKYLNDTRFKYIKNSINIGALRNFNIAIENCKSDFLLLTHDDDIMHPDMVKKEIEELTVNLDVDLVCVNADFIDVNGNPVIGRAYDRIIGNQNKLIRKGEYLKGYIHGKNYICCPTVMLRVKSVNEDQIRYRTDVGKSADTFFWFELNKKRNMKYLQEKLFFYRLHDAQDSRNSLWMIPMLKKPVLDSILDKHYTSHLGKQWISYANNQIKHEILRFKPGKADLLRLEKNVVLNRATDFVFQIWFNCYKYFPRLLIVFEHGKKKVYRCCRYILKHIGIKI